MINDFYHLLVRVALRHSHQSAKFSYSVIHVNDEVAYLKLLYLFQRECHLSATSLVGA